MFGNKKIAVFALTPKAEKIALKLKKENNKLELYLSARLKNEDHLSFNSLSAKLSQVFRDYDAFIFIMALGIVVRIIAPLIKSKKNDPAVITIDDQGEHVISTLSGHLGGANQLTQEAAELLNSKPVITTATDLSDQLAVDLLAKRLNCRIKPFERLKKANSALLFKEELHIFSDYKIKLAETENLKIYALDQLKIDQLQTEKLKNSGSEALFEIIISNKNYKLEQNQLQLIPQNIVLGIGCRKNTSLESLKQALKQFLADFNLAKESIKKIATIDLKKDEEGILKLAAENNWPLDIIEREEIEAVEEKLAIKKSDFVKKITGVYAAAAPAAVLASDSANLIIDKEKYSGITLAAVEEEIESE